MKSTSSAGLLSYLLPSPKDTLFICLLLVVCLRGSDLFNADSDLGRHITIGRYILANGIPYHDIFSHTLAGQYLVSHEWLAQILFAAAHAFSGLSGTVLLTAVLIATTFTLTYREILRRGIHHVPAVLFTILAAFASIIHWLARPHIFTFLFTALWTYSLQKVMEGKTNKLWIFPLLMLVWANTHGAFISGFVTLFAYLAGWVWEYVSGKAQLDKGKNLALIGLTSFAATWLNPYGGHLWTTSTGYFGNRFLVDYTIEYQSPNFHEFSGLPFLLLLCLGFVAPTLGRTLRPHEAFLFAGWCALGLYSERNIPLFAIVTAPYLAFMLQPVFESLQFSKRLQASITQLESQLRGNGLVIPLLTTLIVALALKQGLPLDSTGFGYQHDPAKFPVHAARWLKDNPQSGNMFNHFNWGGYLLYQIEGKYPVFIDGQTDFYGEALTLEYVQVTSLKSGWQDILTKYDIAWAIIRTIEDQQLAQSLQTELGWEILYQDDLTIILHRH